MGYKFNPFTGTLDLTGSAGGGGDVVGPASSTDHALVRFDGTTGKLLQNSAAVLTDGGRLTLTTDGTGSTEFNAITINNATGGAPRIDFGTGVGRLRTDGFNCISIDGSGQIVGLNNTVIVGGSFSITNVQAFQQNGGIVRYTTTGAANSAWAFGDDTAGNDWDGILKVTINKASNRAVILKAAGSQTANISEIRNSSDAVLNYVAANGSIQADSGFGGKRRTTAVSAAATATDFIIGVTDNSSARTITLDNANTFKAGQLIIIKDEAGTAASANNITVAFSGGQTCDGEATLTISANYGVAKIYSNGTDGFFTL